jgi:hypothetical protein
MRADAPPHALSGKAGADVASGTAKGKRGARVFNPGKFLESLIEKNAGP